MKMLKKTDLTLQSLETDEGVEQYLELIRKIWGEEIRWLTVCDRADRELVENTLVTEAEKLVHGQSVFTSVDSESPKINEWVERGYRPEGGLYQMIAKLEGIRPVPTVPEGIVLRSMKPCEAQKVVETKFLGGRDLSSILLRKAR
jgi:hypothetical protein